MRNTHCDRCKKKLSDYWEDHFASGKIRLNIGSHMFDFIDYKHPVVKKIGNQNIEIEYGDTNGCHNPNYQICFDCQEEIVTKITELFKI
jgi:hypothetical protein